MQLFSTAGVYLVMACIGMAYIVLTYTVMAYTVMVRVRGLKYGDQSILHFGNGAQYIQGVIGSGTSCLIIPDSVPERRTPRARSNRRAASERSR